MKKEHWLYLVIAILAIWIIASYMTSPKTGYAPDTEDADEEEGLDDEAVDTDSPSVSDDEETNGTGTGVNIEGTVTMNPVTIVEPNKGTVVGSTVPSTAKVSVSNQVAGDMVKLGSVDMTVDGWVVVHEERDGKPGNILGAQRFDAGSYAG